MSLQSNALASSTSEPANLLRRAWEGWKKIAHVIGVFNTRVIMSILYFLIVLPFGLVFRVVSDPLQMKEPAGSNWVALPQHAHNLDTAHDQF